jgi:hypothetical protein
MDTFFWSAAHLRHVRLDPPSLLDDGLTRILRHLQRALHARRA